MKSIIIIFIILILSSCNKQNSVPSVVINEAFQTQRDEPANIDSPAIWHSPNGENWLISTAKSADALYISNAENGKRIRIFSSEGDSAGYLDRPNGVSVFENHVFVVERNNQRVQVFSLPALESVGMIAEDSLIKPYGLYI